MKNCDEHELGIVSLGQVSCGKKRPIFSLSWNHLPENPADWFDLCGDLFRFEKRKAHPSQHQPANRKGLRFPRQTGLTEIWPNC